jgi:hypothetical protein
MRMEWHGDKVIAAAHEPFCRKAYADFPEGKGK